MNVRQGTLTDRYVGFVETSCFHLQDSFTLPQSHFSVGNGGSKFLREELQSWFYSMRNPVCYRDSNFRNFCLEASLFSIVYRKGFKSENSSEH
jgi:hypothetical protein